MPLAHFGSGPGTVRGWVPHVPKLLEPVGMGFGERTWRELARSGSCNWDAMQLGGRGFVMLEMNEKAAPLASRLLFIGKIMIFVCICNNVTYACLVNIYK